MQISYLNSDICLRGEEKLLVTTTDRPTDRANIVQSAFSKVGKKKADICNFDLGSQSKDIMMIMIVSQG